MRREEPLYGCQQASSHLLDSHFLEKHAIMQLKPMFHKYRTKDQALKQNSNDYNPTSEVKHYFQWCHVYGSSRDLVPAVGKNTVKLQPQYRSRPVECRKHWFTYMLIHLSAYFCFYFVAMYFFLEHMNASLKNVMNEMHTILRYITCWEQTATLLILL